MTRLRRVAPFGLLAVGGGLIVLGLGLVYLPAGIVAGGALLLALVTFDPERVSRLTWPR